MADFPRLTLRVGFTGTRTGMTRPQMAEVGLLLRVMRPVEVHHGDCVGADADFDMLAHLFGGIRVVIHPPADPKHRAFCPGGSAVESPRPYLDRNVDIVEATDLLIATPKEARDPGRGGTWWTVRYARERGREIHLVYPDGCTSTIPAARRQGIIT